VLSYFDHIPAIEYAGPDTDNPLAFRFYDRNRVVLGKRMEEHLRFAICYWHSFTWNGFDPFGYEGTFDRPWHRASQTGGDAMQAAKLKATAAFELFEKLGVPFYTFHDRDVAPEGNTPRESLNNLQRMIEVLARHQECLGIKPLWGTANLFGHRRYMAGAATNPDPEVFAIAAQQVMAALDATQFLGGESYVLWGGREGYETLLNTDLKKALDQMGRFLSLVVDYKYRIGFKGALLVEPKPREPTKHQYDFDVATVYGLLCRYGLEKEIKVNIEANHATLAGHSFEHEIALAQALGVFGSVDMNRGDPQVGWDTDQFPNNLADITLAFYFIFRDGGFSTGGLNFDAKVRRQSIDPEDLFHGHIGAMDTCARGLLAAERLIQDGRLQRAVEERYAAWDAELGKAILTGERSLEDLAAYALQRDRDVSLASGRQEYLESLINRLE